MQNKLSSVGAAACYNGAAACYDGAAACYNGAAAYYNEAAACYMMDSMKIITQPQVELELVLSLAKVVQCLVQLIFENI